MSLKSKEDTKEGIIHFMCCLKEDGSRCRQRAGNATFSIIKSSTVNELKLRMDRRAGHSHICDYHENKVKDAQSSKKSPKNNTAQPKVDFSQLHIHTLRRYKKHFKIQMEPGLNRAQVSEKLFNHFKTIPVDEKEVVSLFIKKIKMD